MYQCIIIIYWYNVRDILTIYYKRKKTHEYYIRLDV